MPKRFVETMQGTLVAEDGRTHEVSFTIEVDEQRPGHHHLQGVVRAPPWTEEAECVGALTMAVGMRALQYEVHFVADDGRALWLDATKHPRPWRPLSSMTEMPVTLRDDSGRALAEGQMFFAPKDLPAFVASWLPIDAGRKALAARRRAAARRALEAGRPAPVPNTAPAATTTTTTATTTVGEEGWRKTLRALAEVAIPAGRVLPVAGADALARLETLLASYPPAAGARYRDLLELLELSTLPRHGARFSTLSPERRKAALDAFDKTEATHIGLRLLLMPLKLAYLDDPAIHASLGLRFSIEPPRLSEKARWRQQITTAADLSDGEELECDVVVVGTGAGGAPIAKALAAKGHAVLMLEEGPHFSRTDFNGRAFDMMRRLYRDGGTTHALGNALIPLPVGMGVGGTTLVNSGTCLRAPRSTLDAWVRETGLDSLAPERLAPYFDAVDDAIGVAPSSPAAVGAAARLIGRGADALGYTHGPLPRNAPGCDGQGVCVFGCPTDAKRSTNLSYIPAALERGAQLVTGLRVERVLTEGDRAVGVTGTALRENGQRIRVHVRARVVVLACGSLHTPALLLRQGLANGSGQIGKNLSIHPALGVVGLYDDPVDAWQTVPQGYAIHELQDEGILFEGAHATLDMTAVMLQEWGDEWVDLVERARHWLCFGFMIKDTSRGRVTVARDGRPRVRYFVNDADVRRLRHGLGTLLRVYLAGGAREVRTPLPHAKVVRTLRDIEALERHPARARHFDLSAYHPLGTCRMGKDPLRSVVGGDHETHDVHNLFICDGSVMPGPVGANPQLTIMAMSLSAAEAVHRRLEATTSRPARRDQPVVLTAAAAEPPEERPAAVLKLGA